MLDLRLPDVDRWSDRVIVVLGQNPGVFTGPGTNTYLVGTGKRRILLDTGQGVEEYLPVLDAALERAGCEGIQEMVLTHGHPDHIGGAESVIERYGAMRVSKRPWPGIDERYPVEITPIDDGAVVRTEGATLRAVHTPGHAEDHLCFILEQERSLFSGDNVLGVGTTVVPPPPHGDMSQYIESLRKMQSLEADLMCCGHGPVVKEPNRKLQELIDHRHEREEQNLTLAREGRDTVKKMVRSIYPELDKRLLGMASSQVRSHLSKLEREGRVRTDGEGDEMKVEVA